MYLWLMTKGERWNCLRKKWKITDRKVRLLCRQSRLTQSKCEGQLLGWTLLSRLAKAKSWFFYVFALACQAYMCEPMPRSHPCTSVDFTREKKKNMTVDVKQHHKDTKTFFCWRAILRQDLRIALYRVVLFSTPSEPVCQVNIEHSFWEGPWTQVLSTCRKMAI